MTHIVFGSHRNEDDLTVKLTEIVFMNAVIKTGLAKGVTTQNLMVSRAKELLQRGLGLTVDLAGTMGLPSALRRNLHQLGTSWSHRGSRESRTSLRV